MKPIRLLLLFLSFCPLAVYAQTAEVGGAVQDPSGAVIPKASVEFRNQDTGVRRQASTNGDGYYHITSVDPGKYDATVRAKGFKTLTRENITFQVGDKAQMDFKMQVGDEAQTVTVDGSGIQVNTTDGSVGTVINSNFVQNIPLNGRSFQDLISMTPGVLTMSPQTGVYYGAAPGINGDFSINGQRTESNYNTVDGVAANLSAGSVTSPGNAGAGTIGATSALGTTQSLLSVDDLQEFRVESSSYSAEFGRSPGGQLTFITRSGTNAYHGSAYDYLRNGWFDANDWFNDHLAEPKVDLHQNDFGGTFGGPVWIPKVYKGTNKTFFFGSYEGLRLSEPIAASVQYVPDSYMRQQAPAAVQPLLNVFPQQTGHDYGTASAPSLAQFSQAYSVPARIDSSSVRLDHTFTPSLSAFFRFADTPSSSNSRKFLSALTVGHINVQTYTAGATWSPTHAMTNEFRLGYGRSLSSSTSNIDSFGGASPVDLGAALGSTSGVTGQNLAATVEVIVPGAGTAVLQTPAYSNEQHQWNLIDTLNLTHGRQQLKFGVDFRQISSTAITATQIEAIYIGAQGVLSNQATLGVYAKYLAAEPTFNQVALFTQDDWRLNSRLSLSGGLRWELMPPPHNRGSVQPYTVTGSLDNPSTLGLAPEGTPMWHTSWLSFAPRLGVAWQAHTSPGWQTVVRAGGGVFFDTVATAEDAFFAFGFSALVEPFNQAIPFTAAQQNITIGPTTPYNNLYLFPSHQQNPYTLEWNTAVEQGLGANNSATISYIGSAGRRLNEIQRHSLSTLTNKLFSNVYYPASGLTSDYNALQLKVQRSVSKGVTALASYTWSHSIDDGSNAAELPITRGNSDFDVRHSFQVGATWDIPQLRPGSKVLSAVENGWGIDGRVIARTAYPITLLGTLLTDPGNGSQYYTNLNVVQNQPLYLYGNAYPGGKAVNPAAFQTPTGTNVGDAPRNFVRGFGESQVNFAARRDFALSEHTRLQFRAEAFNIFNHPTFGYVDPTITDAAFGQATMTLNQSLGNVASQYQQGGPRSLQFALHLTF